MYELHESTLMPQFCMQSEILDRIAGKWLVMWFLLQLCRWKEKRGCAENSGQCQVHEESSKMSQKADMPLPIALSMLTVLLVCSAVCW